MKKISSIILAVLLFSVTGNFSKAFAVAVPIFPACANPQGIIKVSYDTGTHGVPGDNTSYTGKDTVYSLTNDTLSQCLCTVDGKGIQTNWWKVSSLTNDEIDILKSLGWILISNGLAWGLEDASYLAQNSTFACQVAENLRVGGPHVSDGRSDGRTDSLDCIRRDCSQRGQVLGFAFTGNTIFILSLIVAGLTLAVLGFKENGKKN